MASLVQKAAQINTVGGASASITLENPVTVGNLLYVMAVALDAGAASGGGGTADINANVGVVSDSLGNDSRSAFGFDDTYLSPFVKQDASPVIWGDSTHNTSLFFGGYAAVVTDGGQDTVTFKFTPASSAANCQVGLIVYELAGWYNNSGSPLNQISEILTATPGTFPLAPGSSINFWNGGISGLIPDAFFMVAGGAFTSDGSALNAGGTDGNCTWNLDAVGNAALNGKKSTIGFQSCFPSGGTPAPTTGTFGNSPSSGAGISSVALLLTVGLASGHTGSDSGLAYTVTASGTGPLAGNSVGDTLTGDQVNAIYPATYDRGHTSDGVVYSGTLGWQGRVGIIRPNTGFGDSLFPLIRQGEDPAYCRALAADFTYTPNNGDRVKFIIVRTSAGDRLARAISLIS
jgi:hypothetical protein